MCHLSQLSEKLKEAGFSPAATLTWDGAQQFEFRFTDSDLRDVIYVYADLGTDRVLNVGHTGQRLRGRLRS